MNKKNELYRAMILFEKRIEKNKIKRAIITIAVFSAVIFAAFVYFANQDTLLDYLGDAVASIVLAGINFVVNGLIFTHLIGKGRRNESGKEKRAIIAILLIAVMICVAFIYFEKPVTLLDYLGDIVASIVLAGIYFAVNGLIFSQLIEAGKSEDRALANMKKRYYESKD